MNTLVNCKGLIGMNKRIQDLRLIRINKKLNCKGWIWMNKWING